MNPNTTRKLVIAVVLTLALASAGAAFALGAVGRAYSETAQSGAPAGPSVTTAPVPSASRAPLSTTHELLVPTDATADDLTAEEIADLQYLREEEKLAHDVYVALGEQWNVRTFTNIARSEQVHTDAVKTLLDAYGIDDPADGNAAGVFENDDLQALYNDLMAKGTTSVQAALEVGITIEQVDIADLEEQIARTGNAAILQVYGNLLNGSQNHLRAFTNAAARY